MVDVPKVAIVPTHPRLKLRFKVRDQVVKRTPDKFSHWSSYAVWSHSSVFSQCLRQCGPKAHSDRKRQICFEANPRLRGELLPVPFGPSFFVRCYPLCTSAIFLDCEQGKFSSSRTVAPCSVRSIPSSSQLSLLDCVSCTRTRLRLPSLDSEPASDAYAQQFWLASRWESWSVAGFGWAISTNRLPVSSRGCHA